MTTLQIDQTVMLAPTSRLSRFALLSLVFGLAVATASAGMKIVPPPNDFLPAEDVTLGLEAAAEVRKHVPLIVDGRTDAYVGELGRRLVETIPASLRQPGFRYAFDVMNRMMIASFGLPGGAVLISRGLIEATRTEGQLAAVIAHELSHVALRHATAQATSADRYQIGAISGQAIGTVITGTGSGILTQGSNFGITSYFLSYGVEYERQADLLATRMLARAGYDPRDLVGAFETILSEGAGRGGPQWVSRHPGDSEEEGLREDFINREAESQRIAVAPPFDGAKSGRFGLVQTGLREMPAQLEQPAAGIPVGTTGQFGIVAPSGESRGTTAGDSLVLSVPANWERVPASNTITFAPAGAFLNTLRGALGVTHGVQVGVARSLTGNLQTDMQALLRALGQNNPRIQWTPASQRTTFAGRSGLTTVLNNVSAVTGGFEQVFLSTVYLPDGNFLYVIGLAPSDDAATYRSAFNRVRDSIRVVN